MPSYKDIGEPRHFIMFSYWDKHKQLKHKVKDYIYKRDAVNDRKRMLANHRYNVVSIILDHVDEPMRWYLSVKFEEGLTAYCYTTKKEALAAKQKFEIRKGVENVSIPLRVIPKFNPMV